MFKLRIFFIILCNVLVAQDKKSLIIQEFNKKLENSDYNLDSISKKHFEIAKKIINFTSNVDIEKVILTHPEDIYFLTSAPHFIHKHILVCTFIHNNDIRIKYDEKKGCFLFHTKDFVAEKRLLADNDDSLVYELDYFALRQKKIIEEAPPEYPSFFFVEKPTSLHPTFQRKADGKYYVEIVSASRDNKLTQGGNHNWLRLIDNKGNVISIGMHPKIPLTGSNGFAKVPVRFLNADVYEWMENRTFYTHTFPLMACEYFSLKADIIKDMIDLSNNNLNIDYSIFGSNCCDWIVDKLSKYIYLDKSAMQTDAYNTVYPDLYDSYRKGLSEETKMLVYPLFRLIQCGVQLPRLVRASICGGFSINEENKDSKSFFSKENFLLDLDLHTTLHPYLFEEYLQKNEADILQKRIEYMKEMENCEYTTK